jgi:SAM-dependent methyltransferase
VKDYVKEYFDRHAHAWVEAAYVGEVKFPVGPERVRLAIEGVAPAMQDGARLADLGCGGGQLAVHAARLGWRPVGVDVAPSMVELARERRCYADVLVADAAALPLGDGAFDLVMAYMTFQDMDDLDGALSEAARVLEPGGHLCAAFVHPFASGRLVDGETDYFEHRRYTDVFERDGLRMAFHQLHRPLSAYFAALRAAGFVVEDVREPLPPPDLVAAHPTTAKNLRRPCFLHLLARR